MGATALWCFSCFGVSGSVTNEMPAKVFPRTGCSCQMLSAQQNHSSLNGMEGSRAQPGAREAITRKPLTLTPLSSIWSCWTPFQRKALCGTFSHK